MNLKLDQLPTLYGINKNGGYKIWTTWTEMSEDGDTVYVCTEYGQLYGAQQTSKKKVAGKNIGRSNETTAVDQARINATSLWNKKYDENYRETLDELQQLPVLPMLAHKYKDHKNKLVYPAFVQPKLNGVRCIVTKQNNRILYTSRKGKEFKTLNHLTPYFDAILAEGEKIDGEMYRHGLTFQAIIKRLKRVLSDRSDIEHNILQYHAFDLVDEGNGITFEKRFSTLKTKLHSLVSANPSAATLITLVDSFGVESESDILRHHKLFVAHGYEGTIIRSATGLYLPDYRSYDLLKLKDFHDQEFEIVDFLEGTGREEGAIIFNCKTETGETFKVRPRGELSLRKKMYREACKNPSLFIGEQLTVRYQDFSEDGVPVFGVGIAVRNYE